MSRAERLKIKKESIMTYAKKFKFVNDLRNIAINRVSVAKYERIDTDEKLDNIMIRLEVAGEPIHKPIFFKSNDEYCDFIDRLTDRDVNDYTLVTLAIEALKGEERF